MMAWGLSVNWETELLRARLIEVLGPERAAELEPLMPDPVVTGGAGQRGGVRKPADLAAGHNGSRRRGRAAAASVRTGPAVGGRRRRAATTG